MDVEEFLKLEKIKLLADKKRLTPSQHENNSLQDSSCFIRNETLIKSCNEHMDFQCAPELQHAEKEKCTSSSMATLPSPSLQLSQQNTINADNEVIGKFCADLHQNIYKVNKPNSFTKLAKDLANLSERQVADVSARSSRSKKTKDEMEQWVSDTFYSYFPGFNNENKKRQDILRDRQLEYQQNFLKHQMTQAAANAKEKRKNLPNESTKESAQDQKQKPVTSRSDKTELEIIVNNPDYEAKSPRPGSARHKLLQDLKHTEISNIVNSDGVTERNRRNAEMEMAKKKNYQKELMAQIEEKRRVIEELKEKERRQEEALTRKLQEQLKTMRLEEELEKERLRAEKIRFDSEQSRLMREHLLAKLENDTKLLNSSRKSRSENEKCTPAENKVYKYFSNSARHEYKRGSDVEPPAFNLNLPQSSSHRKEIFLPNENTCPFCDSSLKSYENWCHKCENRILDASEIHLRHLICNKCKKQYSVCGDCDGALDINYQHCQRKKNVCANCRRSFCRDCCGKNSHKSDSEASFQILEVNYPESDEIDLSNNFNNNATDRGRPPYSVNIDRKSIFHQTYDRNNQLDEENNIELIRRKTDNQLSRYLKNYGDLATKALRDNSTQTTPESASRRDVVMVEENNLSMPLLREMPRMTRRESDSQESEKKKKSTRIESLARRWEVPAIQKHTITTNSPKVLTQLGAIRKQLQSEQFQLDD